MSDVTEQAKTFVEEQLNGEGKDPDAATRILRKRVSGRVDPMSKAITAELDKRANRLDPTAGWIGWE